MDQQKLKAAQQLQQQGEFTQAIAIYRELAEQEAQPVALYHSIAVLYAQLEDYAQAIKFIGQAIDWQPNNAALYNSKGNIFMRQQQLTLALKTYQQATRLNPEYAIAFSSLGRCFYLQDKLHSAKKAYEKAIQLDANLADAHYNYAILLSQLGEFNQAIKQLKLTLQLKPQWLAAHGQLAECYLQQRDYKNAIKHYEQRLAKDPDNAEAMHNFGMALLDDGQFEQAIQAFETTLILQANHPECQHHLANAYLQHGDDEKALNYYLRQLEINPKAESYYNIGVLLSQKNRHQEAIYYFNKIVELDPSYLPTYLNLGAIYLKLNQTNHAIEAYQQALQLKPDDKEIQHILAALQQGDEIPEKAPSEYLKSLFDQYATFYDKHLTEHLDYQVPQKIVKALFEEAGGTQQAWKILDLGCGTGLCGPLIKTHAKQLIGIDISDNMIALARDKKVYDELAVMDATDALDHYQSLDLIIAADVFTYIGKLDDLFKKAHRALNPTGLFIFTVEKTHVEPYILQKTIRYAHNENYLKQQIKKNQFTTLRFDNIVLRMQKKQPVEGYLIILERL